MQKHTIARSEVVQARLGRDDRASVALERRLSTGRQFVDRDVARIGAEAGRESGLRAVRGGRESGEVGRARRGGRAVEPLEHLRRDRLVELARELTHLASVAVVHRTLAARVAARLACLRTKAQRHQCSQSAFVAQISHKHRHILVDQS